MSCYHIEANNTFQDGQQMARHLPCSHPGDLYTGNIPTSYLEQDLYVLSEMKTAEQSTSVSCILWAACHSLRLAVAPLDLSLILGILVSTTRQTS